MKKLFHAGLFILINMAIINGQVKCLKGENSIESILGDWVIEKIITGRITGISRDSAKSFLNDTIKITDTTLSFFQRGVSIRDFSITLQDASDFFYKNYGEVTPPLHSLKYKVVKIFDLEGYEKERISDIWIDIILIEENKLIFPFMGYYCLLTKHKRLNN